MIENEEAKGTSSSLLNLNFRPAMVEGKEGYMNLVFGVRDKNEFIKYGYSDLSIAPRTAVLILTNKEVSREDRALLRKELVAFLSSVSQMMLTAFTSQMK